MAVTQISRSGPDADPGATDAELFRRLRAGGPDSARSCEALVDRYSWLALWAARRYGGRGEGSEDLRQLAFVGLLRAIRRFDPDRGMEFGAYARPTVLGVIQHHFRDGRRWVRVPRRVQEVAAAVRTAREELAHSDNRTPSTAAIAAHLDIAESEVLEALASEQFFSPASLDAPSALAEDDSVCAADLLAADGDEIARAVDLLALRPLLAALPERDRTLIGLRFGAELTQSEIGKRLGVSQMHVSRMLRQVLERLRAQLEAA